MRGSSRAEKICTVCEETGEIGDSMKTSSSRMKNKVGAQKGAFIKMKQENMYIYQWLDGLCYVPIIAPVISSSYASFVPSLFSLWDRFGTEDPKIESICRACSVR